MIVMILNFFWIPIIELIWGICFIFVLIFNFIVDYWWAILLLIVLWCIIEYFANYGTISIPKPRKKRHKPKKLTNVKSSKPQSHNSYIGSKWTAFINGTYILHFVSEDNVIFYAMDYATFDRVDNPTFYIKYKDVNGIICFDGSVSIRGESYVFKDGKVCGDTLKVEYRVTTDNYQWGEGILNFGKIKDNGEVPVISHD